MVEFFVQGKPRITTSTGYMSPAPTYTSSTKPKTISTDTSKLDTQLYSDIMFRHSGPMSIPTQNGVVYYTPGKKFSAIKPEPTKKPVTTIGVTRKEDIINPNVPTTYRQVLQETQYKIRDVSQKLNKAQESSNVIKSFGATAGKLGLGLLLPIAELTELASIPFEKRDAYLSYIYRNKKIPTPAELNKYRNSYTPKTYLAPGEKEYILRNKAQLERTQERLRQEGKPIKAFAQGITLEPQFARFKSDPTLYAGRELGYEGVALGVGLGIKKLIQPRLVKPPKDLTFMQKTLGEGAEKTIITKYKYNIPGEVSSYWDDFKRVFTRQKPKKLSDLKGVLYSRKYPDKVVRKLIEQKTDDTIRLLGTKSDSAISSILKGKLDISDVSGYETFKLGKDDYFRSFGGLSASENIARIPTPKETIYLSKDIAQKPYFYATRKRLPTTALDISRKPRDFIIDQYIAGYSASGDSFKGVSVVDYLDDVSKFGKVKRTSDYGTSLALLDKPSFPLLGFKETSTTGFRVLDPLKLPFTSGKVYSGIKGATLLKELLEYKPIKAGVKTRIGKIDTISIPKYLDKGSSKLVGKDVFRPGADYKKLFDVSRDYRSFLGSKGIESAFGYKIGRLKTQTNLVRSPSGIKYPALKAPTKGTASILLEPGKPEVVGSIDKVTLIKDSKSSKLDNILSENFMDRYRSLLGSRGIEREYRYTPGRLKIKQDIPKIDTVELNKIIDDKIKDFEYAKLDLNFEKKPFKPVRKQRFFSKDIDSYVDVLYKGKENIQVLAMLQKQKLSSSSKQKIKQGVELDRNKILKNTDRTIINIRQTKNIGRQPSLYFENDLKSKINKDLKLDNIKIQTKFKNKSKKSLLELGFRNKNIVSETQNQNTKQIINNLLGKDLKLTQSLEQRQTTENVFDNILDLGMGLSRLKTNINVLDSQTGRVPKLDMEQTFVNKLDFINIPVIPITPTPKLPPKIKTPKWKSKFKEIKGRKSVEAYGVEVRKGGVWSRVDMPGQRHNKNSAMHLGIKETSNSPARSFRLVKVGGKPTVYKNKPPKLLNRYYKKSGKGNRKLANAYIEKPKYAIQSKAERKAITQKGWATNRQLKKQRQAQTSFTNKIIKRGIF